MVVAAAFQGRDNERSLGLRQHRPNPINVILSAS